VDFHALPFGYPQRLTGSQSSLRFFVALSLAYFGW
jgi:hypothetical protein